ncbi:MAG: oligosaccharide flippase family protein [Patescibacteria group bacterium]
MPQSIATNTLVAIVGRVVQVALGFAVLAALTRFLGEEAFGQYAAVLAYGSLVLIGADLGLYLTLTRRVGQEPKSASTLLSDITWIRLVSLFAAFFLGSLFLPVFPILKNTLGVFWIAAAGFAAQSLSQLLMGVFQARASLWRASVGDLVGRFVQLGVVLGAPYVAVSLFPRVHVALMVFAFTAGTVAAALAHLHFLPLRFRLHLPPNSSRVREILAESWPAAALLALNAVYFRVDILILSFFRPESEVGLYGLAYRIIESALFLPAAFGGLLLPRLSEGSSLPTALFRESLYMVTLIGSGVSLLLALLAAPIIHFLSGDSFAGTAPLLAILSLALFVMFLGNLFGFTLVARGRVRSLMWLYAGLVIFNVIANLLTIPRYGALAAAVVTVATEVLAAAIAAILAYRLAPYTFSSTFFAKLIIVLLATTGGTLILPDSWHVVAQAFIAAGIFGGMSFALKLFDPKEIRTLLAKP